MKALKRIWHGFSPLTKVGLAVALLTVGVLGILITGNESPRVKQSTPAAATPESSASPLPDPTEGQDPQDRDDARRAEVEREIASKPAFQHLPYKGDDVIIDFIDATDDGKIVIEVRYSGTRQGAEFAYARFLAAYGDPGTAYVVNYEPT